MWCWPSAMLNAPAGACPLHCITIQYEAPERHLHAWFYMDPGTVTCRQYRGKIMQLSTIPSAFESQTLGMVGAAGAGGTRMLSAFDSLFREGDEATGFYEIL